MVGGWEREVGCAQDAGLESKMHSTNQMHHLGDHAAEPYEEAQGAEVVRQHYAHAVDNLSQKLRRYRLHPKP